MSKKVKIKKKNKQTNKQQTETSMTEIVFLTLILFITLSEKYLTFPLIISPGYNHASS